MRSYSASEGDDSFSLSGRMYGCYNDIYLETIDFGVLEYGIS